MCGEHLILHKKNLTDAGYNASIADPFRGMPYYVADQHLSKWRNQYYDLKFRAATPLLGNHWALGLEGNYVATLAAKQRDPRVDTRFLYAGTDAGDLDQDCILYGWEQKRNRPV